MAKETNNTPTHDLFIVKDGAEDNSFWTKIGAAWAHKDGKGFSIQLDAFPVDGRLSMRVRKPKEAGQPQE